MQGQLLPDENNTFGIQCMTEKGEWLPDTGNPLFQHGTNASVVNAISAEGNGWASRVALASADLAVDYAWMHSGSQSTRSLAVLPFKAA